MLRYKNTTNPRNKQVLFNFFSVQLTQNRFEFSIFTEKTIFKIH